MQETRCLVIRFQLDAPFFCSHALCLLRNQRSSTINEDTRSSPQSVRFGFGTGWRLGVGGRGGGAGRAKEIALVKGRFPLCTDSPTLRSPKDVTPHAVIGDARTLCYPKLVCIPAATRFCNVCPLQYNGPMSSWNTVLRSSQLHQDRASNMAE